MIKILHPLIVLAPLVIAVPPPCIPVPVPEGDMWFKWWDPIWYWYRNDIEQVTVKAGCSFTGYDGSSLNGGSFTIEAGRADRTVELARADDYKSFDERIQSLTCSCH